MFQTFLLQSILFVTLKGLTIFIEEKSEIKQNVTNKYHKTKDLSLVNNFNELNQTILLILKIIL